MKRHWYFSMALLAIGLAMAVLNGCNTWHGAGKDVERAGEKMQDK